MTKKLNPAVIGIVEDDAVHTALIEATLVSAGYAFLSFESAEEFRRRNGPQSVDLLLLDWRMPGESGVELVRALREQDGNPLPVIFVTANAEESHAVTALDAGGDDYLTKPVRRGELLARIRTALRRGGGPRRDHECYGPYRLHAQNRTIEIDGEPVRALPKEFDLMLFLFRRAGRVVSRESVLAHVWRTRTRVQTRTLDTYVSRIRRNFGLDGRHGWVVEGVYLQGYCLRQVGTDPA